MYPLGPQEALRQTHAHQGALREEVARERLARAAQATQQDAERQEGTPVPTPRGFRAGLRRLVRRRSVRSGYAG